MADDSDAGTPTVGAARFIADDRAVDLAAEYADVTIGQMLDLVEGVPFLRGLLGAGHAALQVRDWHYLRKLLRFYQEVHAVDHTARVAFVARELGSPDRQERAGDLILGVIDRSTSTTKAECAGKVLSHSIRSGLDWPTTEAVLEIVSDAYLADLRYLEQATEIDETGSEVEHLLALGLYERPLKKMGDIVLAGVQPQLTVAGNIVREALTYRGVDRAPNG